MYVSKDVAKRIIDESPYDLVWIDTVDCITYVHTKPLRIDKKESKKFIHRASDIDYEDNNFFSRLSLSGVDGVPESLIHNLSFPIRLIE